MRLLRPVFFALLLLGCLIDRSVAETSTTCQKAYSLLEECGPATAGCCALVAAFQLRGCVEVDEVLTFLDREVRETTSRMEELCKEAKAELRRAPAVVADARVPAARVVTVDVEFSSTGGVGTQARPVLDALSSLAKDTLEFESANTLEVQDLSITYHSGPTCSCDNIGPAPDGPSCIAALRRKVYALRLWACKLMCGHLRLVMAFMLVQIALLGLWIVILLSQPRGASKGRRSRSVSPVKRPGRSQFVVHAADYADPELGRPLLRADE